MTPHPTIYDIAEKAHVHPSTVSRALSRPGRISARTESRIRAVAEHMGYLMPSDDDAVELPPTGMMAAVVPSLNNPIYASTIQSMHRRLEDKGYGLIILDTDQQPMLERKAAAYVTRNTDAVALLSSRLSEPDIRRILLSKPIVLLNRTIPGVASVSVDMATAIDDALHHLRRTGHTSITYLAGPSSSWSNEYRRRFIRAAAFRYDITYRVVRECEPDMQGGPRALDQYLLHPTDAVFAFNDQLAAGFIAASQQSGIRVPDDISVIGCDGTELSALLTPSLSTIALPWSELGLRAADAMINAVRNPRSARPEPIRADATFISRTSVAAHKRSTMKLGPYAEIKHSSDVVTITMLSNAFNETMPRINEFMRRHPNIIIDPIEGRTQEATIALYWERVINHASVPDLLNVERSALPQFAASGALLDISGKRIEQEVGSRLDGAAWQSAHYAGRLYGIPGDQSQTVLFYRSDLLERYDLALPRTWDQFYEEGVALHRRNPKRYMGILDTTDIQHYLSFFRAAGAKLWTVTGASTISLDMTSPACRVVSEFIQQCLDAGVLLAEPLWDNRYMVPKSGKYLTIAHANWLGKILASSYPADKGLWKVALPPSFSDSGRVSTAEIGGSTLAVSANIPKKRQQAALTFARWFQLDPVSIELRAPGGVSAASGYVEDLARRGDKDSYFEQSIYDIYAQSAKLVNQDWDHLPFYTQLESEFKRLIVPELKPGGHSVQRFKTWEQLLARYAVSQGFTVN